MQVRCTTVTRYSYPPLSALAEDSPGRVTYRDGPVFFLAWSASLPVVSTFSATAALPYEHLDRATAGLRTELRRQVLAADVHTTPRWDTFAVTGPREFADLRGRVWYEYRATVESRPPFPSTTTGTPSGQFPAESG
jgi:hypothetical protein